MIIKADTSLKTIYRFNPVVLKRNGSTDPEAKPFDRTKRWMLVFVLIVGSLICSYFYWFKVNDFLPVQSAQSTPTSQQPVVTIENLQTPAESSVNRITTPTIGPNHSTIAPPSTPNIPNYIAPHIRAAIQAAINAPIQTASPVTTAKPIQESFQRKPMPHRHDPVRGQHTPPPPATAVPAQAVPPAPIIINTHPTPSPTTKPTYLADPDNPFINYEADFKPFVSAIKRALDSSGKLNASDCSVPDGAVIFTLSNYHTFPLLQMRQDIMTKAGILTCLQQRFITVCLDKKCLEMCENGGFTNCVQLIVPETVYGGFGVKTTAYQKNSYNYIVWVKYEMFVEALMVANEVFYFDADVMVYANPFPHAQNGRDQMGRPIPGPYELMYQRERGMKERGCGGSVNGGLFYLRNSTNMHAKFLPAILKHREDIINLPGRLDQDIVGDYVRLVKYCTLPVNRFMGFCISSQDANGYNPKEIVTFHPNCVAGMQAKTQAIKDFSFTRFGSPI